MAWALPVCLLSVSCWMRGCGGSALDASDDEPIVQICRSPLEAWMMVTRAGHCA